MKITHKEYDYIKRALDVEIHRNNMLLAEENSNHQEYKDSSKALIRLRDYLLMKL